LAQQVPTKVAIQVLPKQPDHQTVVRHLIEQVGIDTMIESGPFVLVAKATEQAREVSVNESKGSPPPSQHSIANQVMRSAIQAGWQRHRNGISTHSHGHPRCLGCNRRHQSHSGNERLCALVLHTVPANEHLGNCGGEIVVTDLLWYPAKGLKGLLVTVVTLVPCATSSLQ
jgi:hypothetical protein